MGRRVDGRAPREGRHKHTRRVQVRLRNRPDAAQCRAKDTCRIKGGARYRPGTPKRCAQYTDALQVRRRDRPDPTEGRILELVGEREHHDLARCVPLRVPLELGPVRVHRVVVRVP